MNGISLRKKIIFLTFAICAFLVSASFYTSYQQSKIANQFKSISINQFPKVETLSKLVASFRLIRINVRTLGLTGNTNENQAHYIKETKHAIESFLKLNTELHQFSFNSHEQEYLNKLDHGWNEFLLFGKGLLAQYENPTEESLKRGSYLIREICPLKAKGWMDTAE